MHRQSDIFFVVVAAVVAIISTGCARVRPWQRGDLAASAIVVPLTPSPLAAAYQAKLLESRTGGGITGVAAGGGCGCTQ